MNVESGWRKGDTAPRDGVAVVAIGRVIWDDSVSVSVDGFTAAIRWLKGSSGYEGWYWDKDGLTVAQCPSDEVMIDWWMPMPEGGAQ